MADAFLADFSDGDEAAAPVDEDESDDSGSDDSGDSGSDEDQDASKPDMTADQVSKLLHDPRLPAHVQRLDRLLADAANPAITPLTREQEYPTIVASNDLVVRTFFFVVSDLVQCWR